MTPSCLANLRNHNPLKSLNLFSGQPLSGLAPLREVVQPPRRPLPGRGRGRPCHLPEAPEPELPVTPLPPVSRFERPAIDYVALDDAIAFAEQAVRRTRRSLVALQDKPPAADRRADPADAAPEPVACDA